MSTSRPNLQSPTARDPIDNMASFEPSPPCIRNRDVTNDFNISQRGGPISPGPKSGIGRRHSVKRSFCLQASPILFSLPSMSFSSYSPSVRESSQPMFPASHDESIVELEAIVVSSLNISSSEAMMSSIVFVAPVALMMRVRFFIVVAASGVRAAASRITGRFRLADSLVDLLSSFGKSPKAMDLMNGMTEGPTFFMCSFNKLPVLFARPLSAEKTK